MTALAALMIRRNSKEKVHFSIYDPSNKPSDTIHGREFLLDKQLLAFRDGLCSMELFDSWCHRSEKKRTAVFRAVTLCSPAQRSEYFRLVKCPSGGLVR